MSTANSSSSALLPDLYFVKVTFAAFAPTFKKDIKVQPGMRSILNVRLDTLFSSLQLSYPTVGKRAADVRRLEVGAAQFFGHPAGAALLDRPAWMAPPGRPHPASPCSPKPAAIVKVSGGEGSSLSEGVANQADMGTAFALATSLYGNNLLQVAGNLGYGSATGFRWRHSAPAIAATSLAIARKFP